MRPAHQPGAPHLRINGLSVQYEDTVALDNLSFELEEGVRVAVVGPNGAGKSTLFKVIAGVQAPTQGEVQVYGNAPDAHVCVAYVPQRSQVDWRFPATVWDVVMMGRVGQLGLLRWPGARDRAQVRYSLELVGAGDLAGRQIGALSGGQQQRVFIARALAQQATLILMDEPFNGLDAPSQAGILDVLDRLKAEGVTVMVAMHDLTLAAERFERILLLNRRLYGFDIPANVMTADRLLAAYGGQIKLANGSGATMLLVDECCDDPTHDGGSGGGHELAS